MNDTEVKNSNNSLILIVDHMEMGRPMIGVVHLDHDSVEPAYRRHGRRLPFGLMLVNFHTRARGPPLLLTLSGTSNKHRHRTNLTALNPHNIELSCPAASSCSAWNSKMHAPLQAAYKGTTAAICYSSGVALLSWL